VRDNDVVAAADPPGLAMVFTGMRHFLSTSRRLLRQQRCLRRSAPPMHPNFQQSRKTGGAMAASEEMKIVLQWVQNCAYPTKAKS